MTPQAEPSTRPSAVPGAWLVAAWPGMGGVAVMSAGYLVQQLGLEETAELPARDYFDVNEVTVHEGILLPIRLPRGVFFRGQAPGINREIVVFLGEVQPSSHPRAYARDILDMATSMGIDRVVTFASMASALHPSQNPKVTGVATEPKMLEELQRAEVEPLAEGQIGGMNGLILSAAAERGLPGFCLLAEIPYFAAGVPNPKAARAALSVFSVLSRIELSLTELDEQAVAVDQALIAALERMQQAEHRQAESTGESEDDDEGETETDEAEGSEVDGAAEAPPAATPPPPEPTSPERKLDFASRRRIEQLFQEARTDASKAIALKAELDRLGIFARYEDRFLDLFRRAE